MKKLNYIVLFSTVLAISISSCKKEEDDTPAPAPTKTSMLTGTWKTTALTVSPAIDWFGTQITDIYNSSFYPNCSKDDLYVFSGDKTYEFNEGPSKCNDTDPQILETGTWSFNSDETYLLTTPAGSSVEEYKIDKLTSSEFVSSFTEYDSLSAVTYTFIQTMTKQ